MREEVFPARRRVRLICMPVCLNVDQLHSAERKEQKTRWGSRLMQPKVGPTEGVEEILRLIEIIRLN